MLNIKITNKNTENHLSEILKRTDFTDLTQYLDARASADAKVLKQNRGCRCDHLSRSSRDF